MTRRSRGQGEASGRRERGRQFWTVEHLTSAPVLLGVSVVLLCAIGLLMVFSASSIEAVEAGGSAFSEALHQAAFLVLAVGCCLVVRAVGGSFWVQGNFFYVLWGFVVLLLVAVLVMGSDSHGATRWLYIGPVSLQPSEFAKIVLVMAGARILARWERREYHWTRCLVMLAVFVGLPLALILLQKDLGTLLIVCAALLFMAILAGMRLIYLVPIIVAGVLIVAILILSAGYRSARFAIWLDPYSDYHGDGWQLIHGLYSFALGGFWGVGLGNSREKYSWLPEAENDFIFAVIGEELGFVGAVLVVGLFVLFGWSGMRIAYGARDRDRVSSLMAAGLTIIILVQALLNMGGVLQVLPLSGRPLPFISSGGSSILANMIMVGLILGVARENEASVAEERARLRRQPAESVREFTVLEGGASKTVTRSSGRRSAQSGAAGRADARREGRPSPKDRLDADRPEPTERGRR